MRKRGWVVSTRRASKFQPEDVGIVGMDDIFKQ